MVTRRLFLGFLGLLALQRILELLHSKRNESWILKTGGIEHAPGQFVIMKLFHFTWFFAMIGEVFFLKRSFVPVVAAFALLITSIGQGLRYAAIRSLGHRWTVRIMILPDSPPIVKGLYKYIRHPNYAGVILEVFAVPLLHSAYLTSIIGSILNGLLLAARIRREEKALIENGDPSNYRTDLPRFFPAVRLRNH